MKPRIAILHHLHRTGGTLISKCVASLPDIALLSEVHPDAPFLVLDAAFQGNFWLRLVKDSELEGLNEASFLEKVQLLHRRATARGEHLVIRNWCYLDFFAKPFADQPTNRLSTSQELAEAFDLREAVTVRHPMDQWLSWLDYGGSAQASDFSFESFVAGVRRFADSTCDLPTYRYEDFVRDPRSTLAELSRSLGITYADSFQQRWPYYHQITGDDNDRASGDWKIAPRPRRQPADSLANEARDNPQYQQLIRRYGYPAD